MSEAIQVTTTTASKDDAKKIARELVEGKLAACVQIIGPLTSIYRWQEEVEEGQEYLCLIKTQRDIYLRVEATIQALHPYDVPEILVMPVVGGSRAYLDWLAEQIG